MSAFTKGTQQEKPLAMLLTGVQKQGEPQSKVRGIQLDSRRVCPGDLFIALRGHKEDGTGYIDQAVEKGAVAVLVDLEVLGRIDNPVVEIIGVKDLRARVSEIAGRFYGEPSKRLTMIGVTGTNGKSSCCQFVAEGLSWLGRDCGQIGTLGYGMGPALLKSEHTTPDAISIQRILAELQQQGVHAVAMEVSSHGMDQGRVNAVAFKTAVFTNLSRDHLDYHQSMEDYAQCKKRFLMLPGIRHAVINLDDDYGRVLAAELPRSLKVMGFSLEDASADVHTVHYACTSQGLRASLKTPWGEGILSSGLLGKFNLSNLLAVTAVLCLEGYSLASVLAAIKALKGVPGRMQAVSTKGLPTVVIDYAHSPDALERVLTALRPLCAGQLWCVFGCGGDRDTGKRPLMGAVVERLADQGIVTNDNPRHEDPEQITQQIIEGMKQPQWASLELDRAQAIHAAISKAQPEDMVLVAGKGHESWQEVKGARIAFSDLEQVKQALHARLSSKGLAQ